MNPENYFFFYPQYPQITDNPRTETVGINNSNPQYDLDVRGTVHACNLLSYTANLTDIDTSLIVASNVLASNVLALSAYASNLDTTNLSIQETSIGSACPNSNGLVDYTWLIDHGLSNLVWREYFAGIGGAAGGGAAGVAAYAEASVLYSDPLTSVCGIAAFDQCEITAPRGDAALGYTLAVETLVPLGQYIAALASASLGTDAAKEAVTVYTVTPLTTDLATSIGAEAGLAAEQADGSLPSQGWITKSAPVITALGKAVGQVQGNTNNITANTATLIDHTAQLETLTADVSSLDTLTATHTADIALLNTGLATAEANITALDASVAAIEIELTSTTNTANAAQTTALWDSNNFANYLPLSGGTMSGILTAYSNIVMNSPMMLTGSNSTTAANLLIDPAFMRYVNSNGIQFSVNSNAIFALSTPFIRILGNTELQSGYSNFGRIDHSWVNGFTVGCGLCNNAPNGFEWFNVGSNSSVSTFAHDTGTMNQIVNSNSEIYFGGALLKKDSSITDLNGYTLVDNTGTLRRKGSNITGSTGFSVSPSGYVSAGTGLTIDPYGNLVCSNITTSNITALSYSNLPNFAFSNQLSNFMKNTGGYFTGNVAFGSNTYSAVSQDVLHVFVPAIGGYSSNDFAITSGWGGYYDVCGIAWNAFNIANNYYGRYNNTKLGWSLLAGGNSLVFSCYGAGYTGSNIPQGVSFTPLQLNSNYVNILSLGVNTTPSYPLDVNGQANASSLSEAGILISTKYSPSNVLSNYVLTATANSVYAPSNMLSNYHLVSAFNTFSNFCNSTYVLSNSQSNFVTTLFGNTTYAPSNQLSNYHLLSNFNTYSNWVDTGYAHSNTVASLSNFTYSITGSNSTVTNIYTCNVNSGSGFFSSALQCAGIAMSAAGLAFDAVGFFDQNGKLLSVLQNVAGNLVIDPVNNFIRARQGYFGMGTITINSNDQIVWTQSNNSNMWLTSNSLNVMNGAPFTFNASNVIFTSNLTASNLIINTYGGATPITVTASTMPSASLLNMAFGQSASYSNCAIVKYTHYGSNNAANLAQFGTWGQNQMSMTANGYTGINNTSPAYTLDVNGTVRFTGSQLYLNNGNYFIDNSTSGGGQTIVGYNTQKSSSTGYSVIQVFNNSTDRSLLLCCQSAGATGGTNGVGIFTGSPAYPLDVNGQVRGNVMISQTTSSGTGALKVSTTTNSTDNWWIGFAQGGYTDAVDRARIGVNIKAGGAGQLFFTTGYGGAQTEQMRIMDTGLVGIGTTNPTYKLDVVGGIGVSSNNVIEFGKGWGGKETNAGRMGYGTFSAGACFDIIGAGTTSANRIVRIYDMLGVNTAPAYPLDVNGIINSSGGYRLSGVNGYLLDDNFDTSGSNRYGVYMNGGVTRLYASSSYAPSAISLGQATGTDAFNDQLYITHAGNVGIGTNAPTSALQVLSTTASETTPIVDFRHTNLTQGIGIGWCSINATGTNSNQDIHLFPKGTGGVGIATVSPAYPLDVNGRANATSMSEAGTLLSTKYAPSNALSNYETTSAFNTFSNWVSPLAGTGSNAGSGVIGTATIGNCGCNNYASFSYFNQNTSNTCALLQDSLGNTTISASSNPSPYLYTNVVIKQGQSMLASFNTTSNYIYSPTSFAAPINFNYAWDSNSPVALDMALDNYSSLRIGADSFINPFGQIILGSGVYYQHNISTRHASIDTTGTGNAIDFNLWSCNLSATATATYCSMSVTACNVGINNKNPNIAYKLDVNGGINCNSNLNVVGNTNSFGSLFAGKNTGSAAVAGGGYIVTGNGFDGAATTHTISPLVSGSADNSSGICVVTAKNSSTSSPMNGVMVLSWVKAAGSAQLQPSIINVNQSGMSVFTASNNGANSITVYTPASCSVTYTTMGGC
jgi:hypothetical protein